MSLEKALKPVIKILFALGIFLISIGFAYALDENSQETEVFTDISTGHKNYVAIKFLKEEGFIQGYEDGSFKPLREINRAEALKILMEAFPTDITETGKSTEDFYFEDIPEEEWYYQYIAKAWANNVVNGYPDELFHPDFTINRAEALKIALLQEGLEIPPTVEEAPYTDVPVESWYAPYAQVSKERTLFLRSREDGGLYPGKNMNRAEFAEFMYRLIKSREGCLFARTTWYGFDDVDWSTASGEDFDTNIPTAAHKTLPFGTKLLVTNMANGKNVIVKINDRGPIASGIDLDLTSSAFEYIADLGAGIIVTEYIMIGEDIPISEPSYVGEYRF